MFLVSVRYTRRHFAVFVFLVNVGKEVFKALVNPPAIIDNLFVLFGVVSIQNVVMFKDFAISMHQRSCDTAKKRSVIVVITNPKVFTVNDYFVWYLQRITFRTERCVCGCRFRFCHLSSPCT